MLIVSLAGGGRYGLLWLKSGDIHSEMDSYRAKIPARITPLPSIQTVGVDSALTASLSASQQVLAFNADTTLTLHWTFAQGHVTKGKLANYLTRTQNGYLLNLHNPTPLTTPTIVDESLYVPGGFGSKQYYSFNVETGQLNWAINLDDDGPSAAVCLDSTLLFNTESCTLFAVNRFTGEMKWSYWLGDPLLSTPTVAGHFVYTSYPGYSMVAETLPTGNAFPIEDALLKPTLPLKEAPPLLDSAPSRKHPAIRPTHPFVCIDIHTGKIVWQKWLDGDVLLTAVTDGTYLYLTTFPGTVHKLDAQSGEIVASIALGATSVPSLVGNRIFVTRRADDSTVVKEAIAVLDKQKLAFVKQFHRVEAPYLDYQVQKSSVLALKAQQLDAGNGFTTGAPATSGWQQASENIGQASVASLQLFQASTVLARNNKIYTLMGNTIYCLDPLTEKTEWSYQVPGDLRKEGGALATTPILTDDFLITVTLEGRVLLLQLATGALAQQFSLNKQVRLAPVANKGKLFVPTTTGELVCIDTQNKGVSGWHMFMKNSQHAINQNNH
jgi:outer membrane protein assembly factor BamB